MTCINCHYTVKLSTTFNWPTQKKAAKGSFSHFSDIGIVSPPTPHKMSLGDATELSKNQPHKS